MFSEAILSSGLIAESAMNNIELLPEVAEITLESAADIGNVDLMDFALQSMYEFKMNMQRVDTVAVCEEYAYLKENGVEMVAETAMETIKAWFQRAKDAVITLGKRIAAFFKKILEAINERMRGDSEWLKKHKAAIDKLPATVTLNKGIKGIKFDEVFVLKNYASIYSAIGKEANGCKEYEAAKSTVNFSAQVTASDYSAMVIQKIAGTSGLKNAADVKTMGQFKTALSADVKDKHTIFTTVSNVKGMIDELEKTTTERKAINKCFDDNKKSINIALQVLKYLEKNVEKDSAQFNGAKAKVGELNTCLSLLTTVNRVVTQAFEARRSQYRKLISAAISASGKEVTAESATFEEGLAGDIY